MRLLLDFLLYNKETVKKTQQIYAYAVISTPLEYLNTIEACESPEQCPFQLIPMYRMSEHDERNLRPVAQPNDVVALPGVRNAKLHLLSINIARTEPMLDAEVGYCRVM